MSDYKTTIKSNVVTVEPDKKEVKITCANNKSGKAVMTALTQNPSIFGGNIYDFKTGLTAKDFKVKFKKKDHAETFYDNVMSIVSDPSVVVTAPEESGFYNMNNPKDGTTQNPEVPVASGETSSNMPLIIGGAVVLLVVIGLVIWKLKK